MPLNKILFGLDLNGCKMSNDESQNIFVATIIDSSPNIRFKTDSKIFLDNYAHIFKFFIKYQLNFSIMPFWKSKNLKDLDIYFIEGYYLRALYEPGKERSKIFVNREFIEEEAMHKGKLDGFFAPDFHHELTHYLCNHDPQKHIPFIYEGQATAIGELRRQVIFMYKEYSLLYLLLDYQVFFP